MSFKLNDSSLNNLKGVHPDLIKVVMRVAELTTIPFVITNGKRTLAQEKVFLKAGKTTTLHSRHLDGHAIDYALLKNGKVVFEPWSQFELLSNLFKKVGSDLKIPVEWGGDWHSFKDGCHIQLPYASYP